MDFAQLDLRAASDRGSWVTLKHPLIELGAENPPRINVRGMGSKPVLDAFRRVERVQERKTITLSKTSDKDADTVLAKFQQEIEEAMAALVVAAVAEWQNIEMDGKPLDCTAENVLDICGPNTLFFAQVNAAIVDAYGLFTKPDSAS